MAKKKQKSTNGAVKVTILADNTRLYGKQYNAGDVVEVQKEHLSAVQKLSGTKKKVCVSCKKCKNCK